jgi:hypothetical protein
VSDEQYHERLERLLRRGGAVQVEAPRWSRDLPHRAGRISRIQRSSVPPESELEQIGAFVEHYPRVELCVWGVERIEVSGAAVIVARGELHV